MDERIGSVEVAQRPLEPIRRDSSTHHACPPARRPPTARPSSNGMLKRGTPRLTSTRLRSWSEYLHCRRRRTTRSRRRCDVGSSRVARGVSPRPQRPAIAARNRGWYVWS
jgi:hypothetical protein